MQRIKKKTVLFLSAVLATSAVLLPNAQAAIGVDANKDDCSIGIDVSASEYSEVRTLPITVNIYKVADIDVTGNYTAEGAFAEMDFSNVSAETKAADWESYAAEAKLIVDEDTPEVTKSEATEDGSAAFTDLETGLYLVDAQQLISDNYQYDFTPYLISLPNNYYYSTADDTWVYDLTGDNAIGLKPERTDRYGNLVIDKVLDVYNATNPGGTFVFQIEASKTDVDTEEVKVVYSDVVSMTFESAGTDSITIEDIPAGAEVTVTEVYSGASYKLVSDPSQTVTIIAEDVVATEFVNTHDDTTDGGHGLVNHFSYDAETGAWSHSATEDSTP